MLYAILLHISKWTGDTSYDKIKHLVEIEDDIFAVFTINSKGEVNDLNIAKNIDIEKRFIENISTNFKDILKEENEKSITNTMIY